MTVVGIGGREGAAADDLLELLAKALADHGRVLADVTLLATLDRKAGHPGVQRLMASTPAVLRTFAADVLAAQPVAHASDTVARHVGTPSVAEAAVRAAGGAPLAPPYAAAGWVVVVGDRPEPDLHHHGDVEATPGLVDFAVNVDAQEPPAFLRAALGAAIDDLARYPDPTSATRAVAVAHDVPAESVLLTHGAAEAFTLLARRPWRAPVVVHPQFTEPEAALLAAGHRPDRVLLTAVDDFRLTRLPEPGADLVVVGNPTNPTSRLHDPEELATLRAPGRVVVVDEAFLDVVEDVAEPAYSLVREAAYDPGIVVVRSLTKTFSLAGLRIGYVVAHPDRIAELVRGRMPWPVSTLASAAATACVSAEGRAHAAAVRDALPARLAHLRVGLEGHGFSVVPGARGPFVLARHPEAEALRERLRGLGVAVRRGDTFPGLGPEWLRFAAREVATTDVLLDALARA